MTEAAPEEYVLVVMRRSMAARAASLRRHHEAEARKTGAKVHRDLAELAMELEGALGRPAPRVIEVSTAEAAKRLGCTVRRVQQLCTSNRLTARRAGRDWRVSFVEVA